MKKVFLLLSAVAGLISSASAQFSCGTDEVNNKVREMYPEAVARSEAKLKAAIERQLGLMDWSQFAKTTAAGDTAFTDDITLTVPIVFHIVHDYGSEYVSDEIVYDALKDINECFSKTNSTGSRTIVTYNGNIPGTMIPYRGNAHIQFKLAQKDPYGNPTKGITREYSYLSRSASDQAKINQWPQQAYMNIWLILAFNSNHSSAGAYAYTPTSVDANPQLVFSDGIIGRSAQTVYDHTLAHELAHTLNISHVWGSTNSAGGPCGDDGIDDTPPTRGHNGGANGNNICSDNLLYDSVCAVGYFKTYSNTNAYKLFGVVDPNPIVTINYPDTVNTQNIMDYTGCATMFTYLQTVNMRAALRSPIASRNNLMDTANLILTGVMDPTTRLIKPLTDIPPVADFSTRNSSSGVANYNSFICPGNNVTFYNRSWNDTVTALNWTFTDGAGTSTSSNTLGNVTKSFTAPGWVKVSLTATSNAGTGSITRDSAIFIPDVSNATAGPGYMQEFTAGGDLAKYPIFNYYRNANRWEISNTVGCYDNTSIKMNAFDKRVFPASLKNSPIGDVDDFYTPAFDLSSYSGSGDGNISFMLAGASKATTLNEMLDTLEISYSTNCGGSLGTWTTLKALAKGDLYNAGLVSTDFVPTWADWTKKSFSLPAAARTNGVMFRFRYKSSGPITGPRSYIGSGNNVYIDRIHFDNFPTNIDDKVFEEKGFALAPNPTTGSSSVVVKGNGKSMNVKVQVTDVTGKLIFTTQSAITGTSSIEIPAQYISVKGIYLVQVITDNSKHTEKLIVQ
ncbi:MAG TPA: M43 family zinc metalloprotease [Flavipsychrobacter sp.]|nr:M43 family zinc metalloprotease [Flavipsychrobacter sp.]